MTLRFNSNVACTGSTDAIFKFKEFMKTASPSGPGWSIKASGTGTSGVYGVGDVIASAAAMLDYYWFILKAPTGDREILIQGNSTTSFTYLYIMYSKTQGFTGGTASQRAIATDEVCVFGTYDSGVFGSYKSSNIFESSYFPSYIHFFGDDSSVYPFGFYNRKQGTVTATTSNNGMFLMDECLNGNISDIDNVSFIIGKTSDSMTQTVLSNTNENISNSGIRTYLKNRYNQDSFNHIEPLAIYNTTSTRVCPLLMGTDVITSKDYMFPMLLANLNNYVDKIPYYKGMLKNIIWQGANRAKCSTITLNTTNDYLVVDEILLPWNGSTPTV